MSFTLSDLLQAAYLELGQLTIDVASGGSTTTAIVSSLTSEELDDDSFNNGAIFVISTADGNAPSGEFKKITDYEASTGTFTFSAMTAAVESGDEVGYTLPIYPLQTTLALANQAMRRIGDIAQVDTTTITTTSGSSEYTSSIEWQRTPPLRIRIQGSTGSTDDNQWIELFNWRYQPAAPGVAGKIIFSDYPYSGAALEITYLTKHPKLDSYDDVIHETIHPALATAALVYEMVLWSSGRMMGQDEYTIQRLNDAANEFDRQRILHPVWKPVRAPKLFYIGEEGRRYPGDRTPR